MQNCEKCPYGVRTVGTRGDPSAPVAIVGEAPGSLELALNSPFVGPSGQLLDDTLARVGILPSECFYTNALSCKPPKGTAPDPKAIRACRERCAADVSQQPRKLIIALGNTALRSLTGATATKITQVRGRAIWLDGPDSTPLLPTLHPAAILRNKADYRFFRQDLERAAEILRTGQVRQPRPTLTHVVATRHEADAALAELSKAHIIAADIETTGLNQRRDRIMCIALSDAVGRAFVFPDFMLAVLAPLFERESVKWVWHNGKFDTAFLQAFGFPARVDHDTMLLHYTIDEGTGPQTAGEREHTGLHGLKHLASVYLGADDYDAEIQPYFKEGRHEEIPKPKLFEYNAMDADYTLQLYHALMPQVAADESLSRLYTELLIPASAMLQRVEAHGMFIDSWRLRDNRANAEAEVETFAELARVEAERACFVGDFNPSSATQVHKLIYGVLGLRPTRKLPLNTERATLLSLPAHPFISALLSYRRAQKALSTSIASIEKALDSTTSRIHSSYLLHGTATGRISSRQPNLQNVEKSVMIRRQFAAPPGKILIELDYSQAELRCIAAFSKDPILTAIYRDSSRSLHREVAEMLFGAQYDNRQYTTAKNYNFGIAYGITPEGINANFGIPVEEAREQIEVWFGRFPNVRKFLDWLRSSPERGQTLTTPFGRKRRFPYITHDNLHAVQNEACNFPIQSTASDLTLRAAIEMQPALEAYGAHIINLVHDSILLEIRDDSAAIEYAINMADGIMRAVPARVLGPEVPFATDAKVGPNWADMQEWKV